MAEQTKSVLMDVEQRQGLPECAWEELSEPGTYIDKETGDLYRIPKVLFQEAGPLIRQASLRACRLVQLSKNPFITTFIARMTCAQHNIKSNF
jgi:hypothetical protein